MMVMTATVMMAMNNIAHWPQWERWTCSIAPPDYRFKKSYRVPLKRARHLLYSYQLANRTAAAFLICLLKTNTHDLKTENKWYRTLSIDIINEWMNSEWTTKLILIDDESKSVFISCDSQKGTIATVFVVHGRITGWIYLAKAVSLIHYLRVPHIPDQINRTCRVSLKQVGSEVSSICVGFKIVSSDVWSVCRFAGFSSLLWEPQLKMKQSFCGHHQQQLSKHQVMQLTWKHGTSRISSPLEVLENPLAMTDIAVENRHYLWEDSL